MPDLTGHSIIAGRPTPGVGSTINGVNPSDGSALEPPYSLLDSQQAEAAAVAAAQAFSVLSKLEPEPHATFLETIASHIEQDGERIVSRGMAETGLPEARLRGELGRTTGQLRLFATVVRQGDHRGVRWDPALPERKPLPRPDIRQRKVALGPVVVFGASNFPLAFSVAGGDTASALAAGCPVIVKAHQAHPGTAELVGHAVTSAVEACGLPAGTFSLVYGSGASVGQALVADPRVAAVGFTGSRAGGTALMRTAAARNVPIPVYAEMSSINPVFVLSGALAEGTQALAQAYVASVTGSSGQLCTAPGLAFVPSGEAGDAFVTHVADAVAEVNSQVMLTESIAQSWREGVAAVQQRPGVTRVASTNEGSGPNAPGNAVLTTTVETFRGDPALHAEVFGAASLIVRYDDPAELPDVIDELEGQLTATIHADVSDYPAARDLIPALEQRAGRILFNGWPTGVDVGNAMVHGGPYPATSNSATTSVGTLSIERFLRPVAYQNLPEELLPEPVQGTNPWHLTRRVDGELRLSD